ncbi:MAG: 5-aminopentanamidase [Nocardioidaceae bacterium]|nr:5-aminopentanamidase [Nocardioidaceae bacterium]
MRLALIQPRSASGAGEQSNLDDALGWLVRAADAGADLVVFPECYPGPANPINSYDSIAAIAEKAAELKVHVVAGRIEPADDDRYYVTLHLIDDEGETVGVYRRTTPNGPYIYRDIPAWDFDYQSGADEPAVYDTKLGRIGMLVCSEVYMPELARVLAVKGADLILFPVGGSVNELLPSWRTVLHARAIENLVYTGASQNLYDEGEEGVGQIAGPEGVLESRTDEGMIIADLDMDRLNFLRAEDEKVEFPKRYATVPGLHRWRRPELYGPLMNETSDVQGDVAKKG